MKPLFLFFLLFQTCLVNGQDLLREKFFEDGGDLMPAKGDTVLCLSLSSQPFGFLDTLKGIGPVQVDEIYYLLYKKGNKMFSRKFVSYFNIDVSLTKLSVSNPINIKADSIFSFVRTNLLRLQREGIAPYIYRSEKPGSEIVGYDILEEANPTIPYVGIHTATDDIGRDIKPTSLQERLLPDTPYNLNYKANMNTKLVLFYRELVNITASLRKKYTFTKKSAYYFAMKKSK